jgi:hypothetical protein
MLFQQQRIAAFFVIFSLLAASLTACKEEFYLKQSEVEERLQKELPLGASVDQVRQFIESYKSRFEVDVLDYHVKPESSLEVPEDKQLHPAGYVSAWIRNTGNSPKVAARWNIHMTFFFDENRRLIGRQLRTLGTH